MTEIHELEATALPGGSRHPVHQNPVSHIRREATEPLKSWTRSYAPQPMPRLLLSPYVGCEGNCEFCFTRGFPGLYRRSFSEDVFTVYTNYDEHVSEQLSDLRICPPALLSPYTDPFQPINDRYSLTEKTVKECVLVGVPVEIVTRYPVLDEVVAMLRHLPTLSLKGDLEVPSARVQISIDPFENEGDLPFYQERLDDVERIRRIGIDAVPRIDPLFPGKPEFEETMERILEEINQRDIPHVVVGLGRVPGILYEQYVKGQEELYQQSSEGTGWWYPTWSAQKSMLDFIRSMCDSLMMTLGVLGSRQGQDQYGHYSHPFPWMLPMVHRPSAHSFFQLIEDCPGDCVRCPDAVCGIPELRGEELPQDVTTVDWDRWGQSRLQESLL
ncbi:MAG: hypothetical protein ABEJ65_02575 [bacterium]